MPDAAHLETTVPARTSIPVRYAVAWSLLILVACWTPRGLLPFQEGPPKVRTPLGFDKVVHFGLFLVFGALWLGLDRVPARLRRTVLFGLAFAALSEAGQALPAINRDPSWPDFAADGLGLLAGLAAAWSLGPRLLRRPGATPPAG